MKRRKKRHIFLLCAELNFRKKGTREKKDEGLLCRQMPALEAHSSDFHVSDENNFVLYLFLYRQFLITKGYCMLQ